MAFRATAVNLWKLVPQTDAPTQILLRTIRSEGKPVTTEQLWQKVKAEHGEKFRSKLHMKDCLDVLRKAQRVIVKPVDPTKKASWGYRLGPKPNIILEDGTTDKSANAPEENQKQSA
uniref:HTH HARE-type domain-containing protein n=1 Tax=Hemiselmis andersenii TaxID=464988 RepID=A0A6T8M2F2_HEMAN